MKNFPIQTIALGDPSYPKLLKEIPGAPKKIYVRGKLPGPGVPLVAIVGTRGCTPYGKQVTQEFSSGLAKQGIGIVSGLALGIDGIAHEAALKSDGYTIAVLGTGIDDKTIYPASHRQLAQRILESGGALISEYPPGFASTNYSFQARNRIIAGLCVGTLVTEAPTKSGALITAKHAVDFNRELFIVPHAVTNEKGAGGNGYLRLGARPVTSWKDILTDLNLEPRSEERPKAAVVDETQKEILSILGRSPIHIDLISKTTGLPGATVSATLVLLEMQGLVENIGSMQYVLR